MPGKGATRLPDVGIPVMPTLRGHRLFRRLPRDPAPPPCQARRPRAPRIAKSNARHRDI
ncbi:hypothetical protein [Burkholderia lata]|uniref:hypothetical protein n=1 Tax=Burkholderia lata (strain ATCC 17760 / DSM 23089 / LMG 22485 / NCIMB 9086 / R18194 / 383) TaxID=482957 RepID=UPI0015816F19|nr:hypothetical protein [Burkholderia lata]